LLYLGAKERKGPEKEGIRVWRVISKNMAVLAREPRGPVDATCHPVLRDIVFDPRTYIKCMYGCSTWGKSWICPSAPGGAETVGSQGCALPAIRRP